MAWLDQRPLPRHGYWGPITSSLLWCEEKYVWTRFIAEPANTFSNLFFIALSLYGARNCLQAQLPRRFILVNLGIASIGVGSFFFHMTLRKWAQLLDELPMIYTSALFTYAVCEASPKGRKAPFKYALPVGLLFAVVAITIGYLYSGNPILHQLAYAAIQLASTVRIVTLLRSTSSPINKSVAGRKLKRDINKVFIRGAITFLTAFGIWQIDNIFCGWLRSTRQLVGQPLALLLEGHAWWHLGTGWGAYAIAVAGALLISSLKETPSNFALGGPWYLPHVERLKTSRRRARRSSTAAHSTAGETEKEEEDEEEEAKGSRRSPSKAGSRKEASSSRSTPSKATKDTPSTRTRTPSTSARGKRGASQSRKKLQGDEEDSDEGEADRSKPQRSASRRGRSVSTKTEAVESSSSVAATPKRGRVRPKREPATLVQLDDDGDVVKQPSETQTPGRRRKQSTKALAR